MTRKRSKTVVRKSSAPSQGNFSRIMSRAMITPARSGFSRNRFDVVKRDGALKAASIINHIEKIVWQQGESLADLIKGGVKMHRRRVRFHDIPDAHTSQFRVEFPTAFSAQLLAVDAGHREASRRVIADDAGKHQRQDHFRSPE
jgi:hypothetical protein